MKKIELEFKGYWREDRKNHIPRESGIYCVYACKCDKEKKTVALRKLLYIGGSGDMRMHLDNNPQTEEWKQQLQEGEELCYSAAKLSSAERYQAEAALIFLNKPVCNKEHVDKFIFNRTKIVTTGNNRFLEAEAVASAK